MNTTPDAAMIGLLGVGIGAVVSLVGTVVVPWVRDTLDRKREARDTADRERKEFLLSAMDALLEMRQAEVGSPARGAAQARFGAARNRLSIRLTPLEEPVSQVLLLMLAMVQRRPTPEVENMIGEAMDVLTLWARGEVKTKEIVSQVEERAGVEFSEDRRTASPKPDASVGGRR